jgi:hypothetical protein
MVVYIKTCFSSMKLAQSSSNRSLPKNPEKTDQNTKKLLSVKPPEKHKEIALCRRLGE